MSKTKISPTAQKALRCLVGGGDLVPEVRWSLAPLITIMNLDGTEPEVESVGPSEIVELIEAGLVEAKFAPTDLGRLVAKSLAKA